jgi:hypothetical protein
MVGTARLYYSAHRIIAVARDGLLRKDRSSMRRNWLLLAAWLALLLPGLAWAQQPVTTTPEPWHQIGNTVPLPVSGTTANVQLGWAAVTPLPKPPLTARVCNTGTVDAYVLTGSISVTVTTSTGSLVSAGTCQPIAINGNQYLAAITASSTTTLVIGAGNGTFAANLPSIGALGGMKTDASNATLPAALTNLGLGTGNSPTFAGLAITGNASIAGQLLLGNNINGNGFSPLHPEGGSLFTQVLTDGWGFVSSDCVTVPVHIDVSGTPTTGESPGFTYNDHAGNSVNIVVPATTGETNTALAAALIAKFKADPTIATIFAGTCPDTIAVSKIITNAFSSGTTAYFNQFWPEQATATTAAINTAHTTIVPSQGDARLENNPYLSLSRHVAGRAPVAGDLLGALYPGIGDDSVSYASGGQNIQYGDIFVRILDPTAGSTVGNIQIVESSGTGIEFQGASSNGCCTASGGALLLGANSAVPTGSFQGNGTWNVGGGYYVGGSTTLTTGNLTGSSAINGSLNLQSTSGVGTTDYIRFLTGNAGGTEAMRIFHDGFISIGTTTESYQLEVEGNATNSGAIRIKTTNASNTADVFLTNSVGNFFGLEMSSSGTDVGVIEKSGTDILAFYSDGSMVGTGATGINKGSGTLNLAGLLYNNGTAPTGSGGGYVLATGPTIASPTFSGTASGNGTIPNAMLVAGALNHISYQPGLLTAVNATKAAFHKFSKASTVDNIEGSAATFTCAANPTVTVYECGTSTTCASPTTIGTVTIAAAGTVVDGTVSSAAIAAGDYVAFAMSAGTCASVDLSATVQVRAN